MEYNSEKKEIVLNKELNNLDKFVLDFTEILGKHMEYVVVSGYVSILFGRSRATEDVDLLVPSFDIDKFKSLWEDLHNNGFQCVNNSILEEAFDMLKETAIRFQKKQAIPNMEFKIAKNDLDNYSLANKLKVVIKDKILYISPLEMQIAFKLTLSSEKADKDLEDARHLYKLFKEKLNKEELDILINKLKVEDKFKNLE